MASLKIGALTGIVGVIVGGLIVAYAWSVDWLVGIGVVSVLLIGLFVSVLVGVSLPISNMMFKVVTLVVVFALIVLFGFRYLGVM